MEYAHNTMKLLNDTDLGLVINDVKMMELVSAACSWLLMSGWQGEVWSVSSWDKNPKQLFPFIF